MRLLAIVVLAACTSAPDPGPAASSAVETYDFGFRDAPTLDVLIVIDDTLPMAAYPDIAPAVASAVARSVDDGAQADTRVFVTTTAGDGALLHPASTPAAQPYIAFAYDDHFYRMTNTTHSMQTALGELLDVPPTRDGAVKPLEALRNALDDHRGVFRADAYLALITIAASDDASPDDVAGYLSALTSAVGGDRHRVFAFGIYPPGAPRLDAFQATFSDSTADIADAAAATQVTQPDRFILTDLVGPPCIEEPSAPPYDCAFSASYDDGTSDALPFCTEGFDGRCVDFRDDAIYCPRPGFKRVYLHGFVNRYYPRIEGQCVVSRQQSI